MTEKILREILSSNIGVKTNSDKFTSSFLLPYLQQPVSRPEKSMLLQLVQDSSVASRFPLQNRSMMGRKLKFLLRLVIQSRTPAVVTVLPFGWNQKTKLVSKLASLNTVLDLTKLGRYIGLQCSRYLLEHRWELLL